MGTAFAVAARLLLNFALSPTGRNIIGTAGRIAMRQAQASFIRAMRNGRRSLESERTK